MVLLASAVVNMIYRWMACAAIYYVACASPFIPVSGSALLMRDGKTFNILEFHPINRRGGEGYITV
jgi:hypothetical protein